jgi:hypothetical protein
VKHRKTTPLHPAANGEVERQNRSLMKRIRIAQAESSNWKTEVRKYLVAYRTKPHTVIGIAPSELVFNRKLRTKLPGICVEDDEIRDRDLFAKSKNKRYIDSKRNASERDLQTGECSSRDNRIKTS